PGAGSVVEEAGGAPAIAYEDVAPVVGASGAGGPGGSTVGAAEPLVSTIGLVGSAGREVGCDEGWGAVLLGSTQETCNWQPNPTRARLSPATRTASHEHRRRSAMRRTLPLAAPPTPRPASAFEIC